MLWLILLALAASRATHLVADDLFPFGPLRDKLNAAGPKEGYGEAWYHRLANYAGHGLGCTYCVSIWAGLGSALLARHEGWLAVDSWGSFMVVWFAFAYAVVFFEAVIWKLSGTDN